MTVPIIANESQSQSQDNRTRRRSPIWLAASVCVSLYVSPRVRLSVCMYTSRGVCVSGGKAPLCHGPPLACRYTHYIPLGPLYLPHRRVRRVTSVSACTCPVPGLAVRRRTPTEEPARFFCCGCGPRGFCLVVCFFGVVCFGWCFVVVWWCVCSLCLVLFFWCLCF